MVNLDDEGLEDAKDVVDAREDRREVLAKEVIEDNEVPRPRKR